MATDNQMIDAYKNHKHLKNAAEELGMCWQTLYVNLRRLNVPVTGDKSRYGSDSDRLAAKGERMFVELVPQAKDQNELKFQSKVDFIVNGFSVDVKTSSAKKSNKGTDKKRFGFSLKKQELIADFFVCIGINEDDVYFFLIPNEVARNYQTMSISLSAKGKWWDYRVEPDSLAGFFSDLENVT